MPTAQAAIDDFLAQKRIAVAGVSREKGGKHGGNIIYQRFKERGYEVFAVNPNADTVEGRSLLPRPGLDPGRRGRRRHRHHAGRCPVGRPAVQGARHHPGLDAPLVRRRERVAEAHELCRQSGIASIAGGCPLMYGPTSDGGHRFMKLFAGLFGQLPKEA